MQFDVFENPIARARNAYPYVVVLQADVVSTGDRLVAPIAPRQALGVVAGRLTPVVTIEGAKFVVLVNFLTGVRVRDLNRAVTNLAAVREPLLGAIDLLFFGL